MIARKAFITKKLQSIPANKRRDYLQGSISIDATDTFLKSLTPGEHDLFLRGFEIGTNTQGFITISQKTWGQKASELSPDKVRKVRGKDKKAFQPYRETLVKGLCNKLKNARLIAVENRRMVKSERQRNRYQIAPCFYRPEIKAFLQKYIYALRCNTYCSLSFLTAYCYKKIGMKFTQEKKRLLSNICKYNLLTLSNCTAFLEILTETIIDNTETLVLEPIDGELLTPPEFFSSADSMSDEEISSVFSQVESKYRSSLLAA